MDKKNASWLLLWGRDLEERYGVYVFHVLLGAIMRPRYLTRFQLFVVLRAKPTLHQTSSLKLGISNLFYLFVYHRPHAAPFQS